MPIKICSGIVLIGIGIDMGMGNRLNFGKFLVIKGAIGLMVMTGSGRVVNNGSNSGRRGEVMSSCSVREAFVVIGGALSTVMDVLARIAGPAKVSASGGGVPIKRAVTPS